MLLRIDYGAGVWNVMRASTSVEVSSSCSPNGSLLYLPLDKLIQQTGAAPGAAPAAGTTSTIPESPAATGTTEIRLRDGQRSRDREAR